MSFAVLISIFFVFIYSFNIPSLSFLILTVISRMNSFIFSFIKYFTSTIIDSLKSFIMVDTSSFYSADLSDSRVMSSWVFKVVVMWGLLSWMVEYPCAWVVHLPWPCPLPPLLYLAQDPLFLPPIECCWVGVEFILRNFYPLKLYLI